MTLAQLLPEEIESNIELNLLLYLKTKLDHNDTPNLEDKKCTRYLNVCLYFTMSPNNKFCLHVGNDQMCMKQNTCIVLENSI